MHVPWRGKHWIIRLLADQVLPQLRSRYRVAAGPGTTAIVGSSNGAIHALFAVCMAETFSLVGCLFTHGPARAKLHGLGMPHRSTTAARVPRFRTRWGESDPDGSSDDQTLVTARLREVLLQRGLVLEQSLRYRLAYGDAHNEGAW